MTVEIGLFLLILGLFPLKNLKKQQKSNLAHPECSTNFSDLSFWILHLYTSKGLNQKFYAYKSTLRILSKNYTSFLSNTFCVPGTVFREQCSGNSVPGTVFREQYSGNRVQGTFEKPPPPLPDSKQLSQLTEIKMD